MKLLLSVVGLAVASAQDAWTDCCQEFTADCLACQVGQTPEEYCAIPFNAIEPPCQGFAASAVQCPYGEYFETCHSSNCWEDDCQEALYPRDPNIPRGCDQVCRSGCRCKEGLYRDNNQCVNEATCKSRHTQGPNSISAISMSSGGAVNPPDVAPGPVQFLSVHQAKKHQATIVWAAPAGEFDCAEGSSYKVEYRQGRGKGKKTKWAKKWTALDTVDEPFAVLHDLKPKTKYQVKVTPMAGEFAGESRSRAFRTKK